VAEREKQVTQKMQLQTISDNLNFKSYYASELPSKDGIDFLCACGKCGALLIAIYERRVNHG
jgi:hypothetical protein